MTPYKLAEIYRPFSGTCYLYFHDWRRRAKPFSGNLSARKDGVISQNAAALIQYQKPLYQCIQIHNKHQTVKLQSDHFVYQCE